MRRWAAALAIAALPLLPARAEELVVSLSTQHVRIASNFTGIDLTVFGAIDPRTRADPKAAYDVVVTILGPTQAFVTRRKERVLGLWVNVESREFTEAPAYLAVLSNRPLADIADVETRRRDRLGIDFASMRQRVGTSVAEAVTSDVYRRAFLRLRGEQGLVVQDESAVTFLADTVFRANVPLPPKVPTGKFEVVATVFAGGVRVAQEVVPLTISKTGFEATVAEAARDHALLYGLAVVALSLLTGWFASIIFRRD